MCAGFVRFVVRARTKQNKINNNNNNDHRQLRARRDVEFRVADFNAYARDRSKVTGLWCQRAQMGTAHAAHMYGHAPSASNSGKMAYSLDLAVIFLSTHTNASETRSKKRACARGNVRSLFDLRRNDQTPNETKHEHGVFVDNVCASRRVSACAGKSD